VQIDKMTEKELGWWLNPRPCPENRLSHEEKKRIKRERRKRQREEEEDAAQRAAIEEAEAADLKLLQELRAKKEPEQKPAPLPGPKHEPKLEPKLERKLEPSGNVDAVPKVEANEVDDSCVIVVENNVDVIVLD
jgi:hypothetical protein